MLLIIYLFICAWIVIVTFEVIEFVFFFFTGMLFIKNCTLLLKNNTDLIIFKIIKLKTTNIKKPTVRKLLRFI